MYIRNGHGILKPGGLYLTVSFSQEDPQFGGSGKYRRIRIGTTLHFSSEAEIRTSLSPHVIIRELRTLDIYGKTGQHRAVFALSERR